MLQTAEKIYTVEEYLELEKTSEIRHEYVYGKLIPMAGESKLANRIAGNCYAFFLEALQEEVFEMYIHDVRLMVDSKLYRYPDLVVVPVTDDSDPYATTQPILIIEVLSPSTENIDRGEKLRQYSRLPSLQYYLLISQEEPLVEMYSRLDGRWVLDFFTDLEEIISLPVLQTDLPLKVIYQKVKFSN
jgi:Uma2 family endonuclease